MYLKSAEPVPVAARAETAALAAEPSSGAALRMLRERQGMSLSTLSRLVHYSKSYLSRVETISARPACGLPRPVRRCLVRTAC